MDAVSDIPYDQLIQLENIMFIGHLPAGYLLTQRLIGRRVSPKSLVAIGLTAAVLPDFDLFYFYLIDHGQHLHHTYWTHLPIFWLVVGSISALTARLFRRPDVLLMCLVFYANIFLHLLLDTWVGHVLWLYPFSTQSLAMIEVPARYDWWVWNFVWHWTFLIEVALWVGAVWVYLQDRRSPKSRQAEAL